MDQQTPDQMHQETTVLDNGVLTLPIPEDELVAIINQKVMTAETHYKDKLNLEKRRTEMVDFWIGNHFDEKKFDLSWQVPYKDNIVWQDTETRIAIASGRMPDYMLSADDMDKPDIKEALKRTEMAVRSKIDPDVIKAMIKDGLRHQHLYLTAAIKCRWDPNLASGDGDFIFELVHPTRYGMDHTATIPHAPAYTADNMELVYEWLEEPLSYILAKFPKKAAQLRAYFSTTNENRLMAAKIRYKECHFTWYDQQGQILEGTAWVYRDLCLDMMRQPYFDWDGYDQLGEVDEMTGKPAIERKYRNYFERPRKNYIFFSYQNLGIGPIDSTSAVEQGVPIQKTINKRGRQITEISDRAIPKVATSGNYMSKEAARRISNDPNEILWLESAEDMSKAVAHIPGSPPNPILFQDLMANRAQIDAKFSTQATTRGQATPSESGVSKQITREGDLNVADDMVDVVVERVITEMVGWSLQMMKVMYHKPHKIRRQDRNGEVTHSDKEFTRDVIPDGVAIKVKSSSTDKAQRKANAVQLAGVKAIDPYSLFEAMDVPNPKEMTKRLILFEAGKDDGYARYFEELGIEVGPLLPSGQAGGGEADPQAEAQRAEQDIQALVRGEQVTPKGPPTVPYVQAIMAFVGSEDFNNPSVTPPDAQQRIHAYIQQLKAMAQSANVQPSQPNAPQPN
jgi:hypothetical protein